MSSLIDHMATLLGPGDPEAATPYGLGISRPENGWRGWQKNMPVIIIGVGHEGQTVAEATLEVLSGYGAIVKTHYIPEKERPVTEIPIELKKLFDQFPPEAVFYFADKSPSAELALRRDLLYNLVKPLRARFIVCPNFNAAIATAAAGFDARAMETKAREIEAQIRGHKRCRLFSAITRTDLEIVFPEDMGKVPFFSDIASMPESGGHANLPFGEGNAEVYVPGAMPAIKGVLEADFWGVLDTEFRYFKSGTALLHFEPSSDGCRVVTIDEGEKYSPALIARLRELIFDPKHPGNNLISEFGWGVWSSIDPVLATKLLQDPDFRTIFVLEKMFPHFGIGFYKQFAHPEVVRADLHLDVGDSTARLEFG